MKDIQALNSIIKRQLSLKLGKRSEYTYLQGDKSMANEHIKKCSTSVVNQGNADHIHNEGQ